MNKKTEKEIEEEIEMLKRYRNTDFTVNEIDAYIANQKAKISGNEIFSSNGSDKK